MGEEGEIGEIGEISYGCGCEDLGRFNCICLPIDEESNDRAACEFGGKVKGEAEVGVGVREEESEGGGGRKRWDGVSEFGCLLKKGKRSCC